MATIPPNLTALQDRGFRATLPVITDEPTLKDLGNVTLVLKLATDAYLNREGAGLDPTLLGSLQAYAQKLSTQIDARAAAATAPPNKVEDLLEKISNQLSEMHAKLTRLEETVQRVEENATSGIQSVRAELDSAKKDIQRESKKEFDEVKAEIKEFRTSFGRWSVPSAKKFNRDSPFGTGFQAVAYPNGTFPDEATWQKISSITSIEELDNASMLDIARSYGYNRRIGEAQTPKDFLCGAIGIPPLAGPST